MAAARPPKISPAKLRKAYARDLAAAWARARDAHPADVPYAFVLYGVEGGEPPQLWPCVLTEEGLTRAARRCVDKGYHDTLDEARAALRYSVADSPYASEMEDGVPTVDALVAPHARELDDEGGYALLARAAMAAFAELDGGGLFGGGPDRERLLLMIVTDDTPKDWSAESARRLNPPATFARFEAETRQEGAYASSGAIAVSQDGRSIYSAGSRANPAGKAGSRNEFITEIVACDVRGRDLARRWAFEHPGFGDSVLELAAARDGDGVFALRNQIGATTLMRFSADGGRPMREVRVPGGPKGFALSPDGSRIAVSRDDGTIQVLDAADLRVLYARDLRVEVGRVRFLASGRLLVATTGGVLCLNPAGDDPPTVVTPRDVAYLAADAGGSVLAVAPFKSRYDPNPAESGVDLLRLPSFDPVRTIVVPGHQAHHPALSPDGSLLALEAREIAKPRQVVAAFEIATGREVARRKTGHVNQLCFLPDGRTLAIAGGGITTTEPIELWPVPDAASAAAAQ